MVQVVLILRVRTCAHFLRFEAIWRLRVPFPFNEARLQMPRARKWLWAGVVFHWCSKHAHRLHWQCLSVHSRSQLSTTSPTVTTQTRDEHRQRQWGAGGGGGSRRLGGVWWGGGGRGLVGRLPYSPCHTIAAAGKQWNISLQVGRKWVRTATSTLTQLLNYVGVLVTGLQVIVETFTTMTRSDTHETAAAVPVTANS